MGTVLQSLLVYAVVACCTVYAAWTLAPASLKRRFATALMAMSPHLRSSRRLQGWAQQKGGCGSGCSGCSSGAAPTAATTKPVRIRFIKHR
ncbi:DUF6587 family protein [Rhodoferax sediminis]|uniref:DUF6587 family protein n=1 Tax=Rhodoferax sediminis TaxID=2509614 RepID=UPI003B833AFF